jgi:hypothetical protein
MTLHLCDVYFSLFSFCFLLGPCILPAIFVFIFGMYRHLILYIWYSWFMDCICGLCLWIVYGLCLWLCIWIVFMAMCLNCMVMCTDMCLWIVWVYVWTSGLDPSQGPVQQMSSLLLHEAHFRQMLELTPS